MSQMKELSKTVDELKSASNLLSSVADSLIDLFSGTGGSSDEAKEKQPKATKEKLTLESVRAVLAEKSRAGHTADIKALLENYGASKLSEIDPKKCKKLLEEVKVLGNG